jgi:hypothetical protein
MKYPPTPNCPNGLFIFKTIIENVELTCFLEYSPEEKGSTDSFGAPYEPDLEERMTLSNAYIFGHVDIAHLLFKPMVDHIEVSALAKYKDGDE